VNALSLQPSRIAFKSDLSSRRLSRNVHFGSRASAGDCADRDACRSWGRE